MCECPAREAGKGEEHPPPREQVRVDGIHFSNLLFLSRSRRCLPCTNPSCEEVRVAKKRKLAVFYSSLLRLFASALHHEIEKHALKRKDRSSIMNDDGMELNGILLLGTAGFCYG